MYQLQWHKTITPEKWQKYTSGQQIIMVSNELNRLINGIQRKQNYLQLMECMERIFELLDITIYSAKATLRKELLRFREAFGQFYLLDDLYQEKISNELRVFFRVLLLLNSQSAALL